jgi:hypothetical protein
MLHPETHPAFRCVTCRLPIRHRPTFHVGLAFCCAGCVADGPCICSYDLEGEDRVDGAAAPSPSCILPDEWAAGQPAHAARGSSRPSAACRGA